MTPTTLLLVRTALSAGAAPADAVQVLAAPNRGLADVAAALRAGRGLPSLVASADGDPAEGALLRALAVAEVTGAGAGAAVDGLVEAVAAGVRLQRVVQARTADARLTARLLLALPPGGLMVIAVLDRGARTFLAGPAGLVVGGVALLAMAGAVVWMRALLARVAGAPGRADPLAPDAGTASPTAEALDLLAIALSAGLDLAEALALLGRLGPPSVRPACEAAARSLRAGRPVAAALPAGLGELAAVLDVATRWGAPAGPAVRHLAHDLRERAHLAAEAAAERLATQLVFPTTLLLVPAFGLLVVAPLLGAALADLDLGL